MVTQTALLLEPKKFLPKKNQQSNHPKSEPSLGDGEVLVPPGTHQHLIEKTGMHLEKPNI